MKKYNVYLTDRPGYAQMTLKELGLFSQFKWKFGDLAGYIPFMVKQEHWEKMVNKALKEAEIYEIGEDETSMGAVIGAVNSQLFNEDLPESLDNIDDRIVFTSMNGSKSIYLKIPTIISLLRYEEGERLTRNTTGEILRKIGFDSTVVRYQNKQIRCWKITHALWMKRYEEQQKRRKILGKPPI